MTIAFKKAFAFPVAAALMVAAACGGSQPAQTSQSTAKPGLKIAMIAKSSTNPVFLSARTGAEAAAKELTAKHGVPVEISWLTPPAEDGQVQAQTHRAGGQRGRARDPAVVFRRGEGHWRNQRRRRAARRASHDLR